MHDRGPRQAVADDAGAEAGLLPGSLFLVLESFGFLGLGDLRCDDLEQVPAEPAELAGPELAAQGDHLGLGPRPELGVEVVGQVVEDLDHDGGLGLGDQSVGHPCCDPAPPPVQGLGQAALGAAGGEVGAGHRGPPGAVVAGTRIGSGVVGGSDHPELQLREHRLRPGDLGDRGLLLGRDQEHRLGIPHRRQRVLGSLDRTQDRVRCGHQLGDHRDPLSAAHGYGIRWPGAGGVLELNLGDDWSLRRRTSIVHQFEHKVKRNRADVALVSRLLAALVAPQPAADPTAGGGAQPTPSPPRRCLSVATTRRPQAAGTGGLVTVAARPPRPTVGPQ